MTRPWLCIVQAISAMFVNDVDRIEPLLAPPNKPFILMIALIYTRTGMDTSPVCVLLLLMSTTMCPIRSRWPTWHWNIYRPDDASTRTFAKYMLGRAYFLCGDFSEGDCNPDRKCA